MKLFAISVLSWLAGLVAYLAALRGFWRQRISPGDLRAVIFWSALVAAVAITIGYVPAMFALRDRLSSDRIAGWLLFPLLGIALGVLPVVFIVGVLSKNIGSALVSPEAGLFYCMFGAFGAVFGGGFVLVYGRRSV